MMVWAISTTVNIHNILMTQHHQLPAKNILSSLKHRIPTTWSRCCCLGWRGARLAWDFNTSQACRQDEISELWKTDSTITLMLCQMQSTHFWTQTASDCLGCTCITAMSREYCMHWMSPFREWEIRWLYRWHHSIDNVHQLNSCKCTSEWVVS